MKTGKRTQNSHKPIKTAMIIIKEIKTIKMQSGKNGFTQLRKIICYYLLFKDNELIFWLLNNKDILF